METADLCAASGGQAKAKAMQDEASLKVNQMPAYAVCA